jgi:uncharacterized membrane protein
VVLLAGGRVCYAGPGQAAAAYFTGLSSNSFEAQAANFSNPADFIIAVVGQALDPPLPPAQLARAFAHSTHCHFSPKPLTDLSPRGVGGGGGVSNALSAVTTTAEEPLAFPTGLVNQCRVLLARGWLTQTRQWDSILAHILKNVLLAGVCGVIFYQLGAQTVPSSAYNTTSYSVASVLYFAMLYTNLSNLQGIPQVSPVMRMMVVVVMMMMMMMMMMMTTTTKKRRRRRMRRRRRRRRRTMTVVTTADRPPSQPCCLLGSCLPLSEMCGPVWWPAPAYGAVEQMFAMNVMYVRERSAGLYSTLAYWLANATVGLPLLVFCHLTFLNVA